MTDARRSPSPPAHPRPLPDESLSSLVLRAARANWIKPHSYASMQLGDSNFWHRDPDRLEDAQMLTRVSEVMLLTPDQVRLTTLPSFEGRLFHHHNASGNTRWILPIGIYHSDRRRHGLQFCARCLQEPSFWMAWKCWAAFWASSKCCSCQSAKRKATTSACSWSA